LTYGPFPSVGLFLFLLMLLIAFAYEWSRGALQWPIFVSKLEPDTIQYFYVFEVEVTKN
jgi:hypothetical protein